MEADYVLYFCAPYWSCCFAIICFGGGKPVRLLLPHFLVCQREETATNSAVWRDSRPSERLQDVLFRTFELFRGPEAAQTVQVTRCPDGFYGHYYPSRHKDLLSDESSGVLRYAMPCTLPSLNPYSVSQKAPPAANRQIFPCVVAVRYQYC